MEWMKHLLCLAATAPLVFGTLAAMTDAAEQSGWKRISAARTSREDQGSFLRRVRRARARFEGRDAGHLLHRDQYKKLGLAAREP